MSNAALLAFPSGSTSPDSSADESPALFGRDHEVGELDIALDRASAGRGGALVLRGDAGIGTSALLAALRRTATSRGIPVLSARGVQSESSIPFAGLQELLLPLLGQVDRLQRPQRSTLLAALGFGNTLGEQPRSDVFGIALATIDLLRITTSEPRLLAVDDAHSLDSQTLGVLAFVARRLGQQPCLIAFAARSTVADPFASADLPEMAIDALGNDAARELLAATAPRLPRCVQRGLLSAAAGNPLAIVELARAISPLRDAGLSSGSAFPLSDRLVKAFAGSVAELAPATQALLLVASADPDCGVSELLDAARAASDQPVSVQSIQEAVDAGVVDMDATGIRFRYPLAGAAIYQRASIAERAKAHASLAAVVDDDTARRARHRAAAAVEPDEAVFSELVGAAATAHRCGEALGALTGLLRASGLTRDRERRAEVLLRAGEIAYELGDRRTALNLIARTDSGGRGPSGHGRLMAVRGVVEPTDPVESAHIEVLCRAADDARAAGDIELASKLVSQAAFRCWMGGQSGRHGELVRHNAGGLGFAPADSRLIAILAWAQPADDGADLLERLELSELEPRDTEKLHFLGSAAHALGDLPRASTHFDQLEESYRSSTRVGLLIPVLVGRMGWRLHTDDWDRIGANAEEAATLVEETGDHRWADAIAVTRAMLAARRGDHREADAVAVDVQRSSHSRGNRLILAAAQHARGVAAIGAGRHDEAFDHLRRVFDPLDPAHHAVLCHWTLSDLAEAAQHAGRLNEARELIAGSAHAFGQSRSPIIQIGRRYAAAVLAEEASAEDHFATALKADLSRWPLERARLQLAYGAWLRRNKRVVESRGPLRAARDAFDALGAVPWARRARDELRATGEQSDQPEFLLHDELTAQEVQIARLAATGLTNRQIGQQLYLSPRTIGSHLYRIFPKLGVVSRSQLRSALASTAEETAAGANRLASFAEGHPRLARAQ